MSTLRLRFWWPGVAAVVAVVGALVGIAMTGAANPTLLGDPGAAVRWGLPVVDVVVNLAAALTIGALALAALVVPRAVGARGAATGTAASGSTASTPGRAPRRPPRVTPEGQAWPRLMRTAVAASIGWTLAALVQLVLTYAQVAGRPVGGEGFAAELGYFLTEIEIGRAGLAALLLTGMAALLAVAAAGYASTAWAGVAAVVALAPVALTGHASGSASHTVAVASLWLHLVGVTIWIGGLIALVTVSGALGRDLAPSVTRYSRLAVWAYGLVALSGVINAAVRLGGWSGLATPYGVLVMVKVIGVVVLGAVGWWHRARTVPALAQGRTRAFWRLVAVEVGIAAATMGAAVALAATAPPVPETPTAALTPAELITGRPVPGEPTLLGWLTGWSPDVLMLLAVCAGAGVYGRWVWRLRARGDSWPIGRTIAWYLGLLSVAWATNGGAAVYGHILFSAHMVQHMVLVMVAPIALALAAPVTLAMRALPVRDDGSRGPREWLLALVHSGWARFFAHPIVAAVNVAGSMVVFYFSPLFAMSLTSHVGHLAMIVHFSVAGYLWVNALVGIDPGPNRPAYPMRLVLLFATMAFHAFFGIALTSGTTLLAPDWFGALGLPWGVDALADQQRGGAITWGIGEIPSLALALAVAVAWIASDERTARRLDRAADRDGDAALAAYNAMLARRARGEAVDGGGSQDAVGAGQIDTDGVEGPR